MFKKFKQKLSALVAGCIAFVSTATVGLCQEGGVGVELPALPMEDVVTAATTILAGLGVIWVIRKLIKLSNRS